MTEQSITTQRAQIRAHLEAGNSITPRQAQDLFGCDRLAARIHELKGEGLPILSERPEEGPRFAIYSIAKEG
ncbi:helix-turn-helix domain-containing protein [Albimonas pacifica]|uniref:Helix-turn-helix domain-containing protein n=1 Tax=Albimonas pacifica TaxID=1114924 RepID=A0A1I3LGD7_9RHOB|nr:helix-turn-helix domain-containing protein [Albimonas pacifica]SFI83823.1 Helix-turn-helix domain-containing protein [Albimonas pacifica]